MAKKSPEFLIYPNLKGEVGIRLVGRNGETVIPTEGYTSATDAKRAVRAIQRLAPIAEVRVLSSAEEANRRVGLPKKKAAKK